LRIDRRRLPADNEGLGTAAVPSRRTGEGSVQAGDVIQGRYRLREQLGRGGMAVVWRALDERLHRDVALKLIAPGMAETPEFLARFFSEAQSVARIAHPNVVSVLDFGDHEGRPFLVMEHLGGGSAAECATPLLPERAVEIVAQAAAGAGAAHRAGIVHRDIKPANILLTDEGTAKLADFGIASAAGAEGLTATGAAIGSPHYISPEQAAGRGATTASDVYSLGVVLFELVTGRRLFDDTNPMAVALAHVEREPTVPSAVVADLDPRLDDLVLRCLDKDPAGRFTDGGALAQALEDLAAGLGGPAGDRRPAPAGPGPRRLRRAWVAAGTAALVVVGALAAWAVVGGREEPVARAGTQLPKVDFDRPRSPSPTASEPDPAIAATPSATPSPTPTPSSEDRSGGTEGDEPAPDTTPAPEPTPSATPSPTPTPTPTPEPSEPTPGPSEAPSPEPTTAP
jgi:serine/threonine protein kinase